MRRLVENFLTKRPKAQAQLKAVERVVQGTEPKIRFVSGYQKKLRPAIESSLRYIDALVEQIPGALEVDKAAFVNNPQVHAFFVNIEHLQTSFSRSPELREFFENTKRLTREESYSLMCMSMKEKTIFGVDMAGELLRKDVPQEAVSFSDHQILSPASTEAKARKGLKTCLFNGLVTHALEQIVFFRLKNRSLKNERRRLKIELAKLKRQGRPPGPQSNSGPVNQRKIQKLKKKLTENRQELRAMKVKLESPNDYINLINTIFNNPEAYIRVKNASMRLNNLGVKINDTSIQSAHNIELAEIKIGEAPSRVVVLVKYPKKEMLPKEDFFEKVSHYLNL